MRKSPHSYGQSSWPIPRHSSWIQYIESNICKHMLELSILLEDDNVNRIGSRDSMCEARLSHTLPFQEASRAWSAPGFPTVCRVCSELEDFGVFFTLLENWKHPSVPTEHSGCTSTTTSWSLMQTWSPAGCLQNHLSQVARAFKIGYKWGSIKQIDFGNVSVQPFILWG